MTSWGRVCAFTIVVLFGFPALGWSQDTGAKVDETFLLLMAARNAAKAGKHTTAITRYQKLLQKEPGMTEARGELGWALLMAGRLDQAAREFETVIATKPDDANALRGLLEVARKTGQPQQVFAVLNRLVALAPNDRELRMQLALELHNRGRYAEAEEHIAILLGEKAGK